MNQDTLCIRRKRKTVTIIKIKNTKLSLRAFTHSLIHAFIDSFTHSYIHSCIHSFKQSFIHSSTHSLIHSFTRSLMNSFIPSFTHSLMLIRAFIHALTHSCIHSCVHSLIQTPVDSFVHSFNQNPRFEGTPYRNMWPLPSQTTDTQQLDLHVPFASAHSEPPS